MIRIENLKIRAGSFRLGPISLQLSAGEYGMLMGKTGSGKTTLLESLCGLRPIENGRITLAGKDVTGLRPGERGIGYVPQDGALFPRMSVRKNLAFPLIIRKWPKTRIEKTTLELAKLLDITPLLDRFPANLSGGEQQRVALGRALSFQPQLLLLDEPLSALDEVTRRTMYEVLKSTQTQSGVTTLHVTHNHDEAEYLGDVWFQVQDGQMVTGKHSDDVLKACHGEEVATQ